MLTLLLTSVANVNQSIMTSVRTTNLPYQVPCTCINITITIDTVSQMRVLKKCMTRWQLCNSMCSKVIITSHQLNLQTNQ